MKGKGIRLSSFLLALVLCAAFVLPGCSKTDRPADSGEAEIRENMLIPNRYAVRHDNILFFTEVPEESRTRLIYALDLTNGEVEPLCAKPECTHDSEECNAFFPFEGQFTNLMVFNGALYWVNSGFSSETKLYKQPVDGTGRKEVMTLNPEYERYSEAFSGIYDGRLYRCGRAFEVKNGEPMIRILVYSQELKSGSEPKEIFRLEESEEQNAVTAAAINDGVLYFAIHRYDGESGEHSLDLYSFEMQTDKREKLYSGPVPGSAGNMFYRDGRLVFNGERTAYAYSIEKGKIEKIYGLPDKGHVYVGEETMLQTVSMTGYVCLDGRGNPVYEGEYDVSLLHEDRQTKRYLGCADDVYYFMFGTMTDGPHYNYLVSYNGKTGEFKVLWENRARDQGV